MNIRCIYLHTLKKYFMETELGRCKRTQNVPSDMVPTQFEGQHRFLNQ